MEFKSRFRTNYNIYKDAVFEMGKKYIMPAFVIGIIILMLTYILSFKWFLIFTGIILIAIIILYFKIKHGYYSKITEYMSEVIITLNGEGVFVQGYKDKIQFYPIMSIVEIVETKKAVHIIVDNSGHNHIISMDKSMLINTDAEDLLKYVFAQYYNHIPNNITYGNVPDPDGKIIYNMGQDSNYNNLKSVVRLYIIVSLAVIIACIAPMYDKREKPAKEREIELNYIEEGLEMYIQYGNELLEIQEGYKSAAQALSEVDDILDELDESYEMMDFFTDNREPRQVLAYRLDSACRNLIYIMEKPYSQLNYIEKDEYEKTIAQIKEYIGKIESISSSPTGKI